MLNEATNLQQKCAAIVAAIVFGFANPSVAVASPTSPLCKDGSYRKAHPLICDTGEASPFTVGSGGRQGGGGGLLDVIGDILGGGIL